MRQGQTGETQYRTQKPEWSTVADSYNYGVEFSAVTVHTTLLSAAAAGVMKVRGMLFEVSNEKVK